ncbi:MAG: DNA mismatch repair endonuclease MutL [Oscillospiraceae bacterium]|nr:DNA mismatch repair endonuclease MutL [Oscillospiraceae bacterium]
MPNIRKLPQHIADMIAAGEVVERPANAVKELLENAIDAHAQRITVEIEKGGVVFMRVTDDGHGMDADDMRMAFERHATSKITQAEDLDAIVTLGFRGEALAALSAVSRATMTSRQQGSEIGHEIRVEASNVIDVQNVGCPIGTTVTVRDLFYNIPARYKFLKKDSTEAGYIQSAVMRAALAHPEISVRFIKDGQEIFQTPGDNNLQSAIYCLYGRDIANNMLTVGDTYDGIGVTGFTGNPSIARGNRAMQIFIVNGRPVSAKVMMAALEEAYSKTIISGRFPICVLHLDIDPGDCDINVHPAKSEVKFMREKTVFEAIYIAVRNALQMTDGVVRPDFRSVETPAGDSHPSIPRQDANERRNENITPYAPSPQMTLQQSIVPFVRNADVIGDATPSVPQSSPTPPSITDTPCAPLHTEAQRTEDTAPYTTPTSSPQTTLDPITPCRVIGEALGGYILIEEEGQILLLDKHAAHERILYEKWRDSQPEILSQQLLAPIVVRCEPTQWAILTQQQELLAKIGFELEDYGDGSLLLRAIPHDIDPSQATAMLDEVATLLQNGHRTKQLRTRDEALKQLACKAAIKVGGSSQYAEIESLANAVMGNPDLRYCPHGRPVLVALSRKAIEKLFLRA